MAARYTVKIYNSIGGGGEMPLVEYLYVDDQRLEAYFEQISSPVTYDKVPTWNAEIGFTGPKAGGAQQRFARPYTRHEKISKLTKYLEDEGLVEYERADRPISDAEKAFRLETCQAKRVFIPAKQRDSSLGGLCLWISLMDRGSGHGASQEQRYRQRLPSGNLYLLEGYRDADPPELAYVHSPYSSLQLLTGGGLARLGSDDSGASRYDDFEPDLSYTSAYRGSGRSSVDPTEVLSQHGAQVGPARKIRSLYRIRATFTEPTEPKFTLATFGYPIFIAEGTDTV
jgi:hypothetical protein